MKIKKQIYSQAIVLILIAGFGVAYATGAINFQSPSTVLAKMIEKSESITTEHLKGDMQIAIVDKDKTFNPKISFSGDVDTVDKNNPKISLAYDIDFNGMMPVEKVHSDFISINDIVYMKLSGIDNPEYKQFFPIDKWVYIDTKQILKLSGQNVDLDALKKNGDEYRAQVLEIFKNSKVIDNAVFLKAEKINGQNSYHMKLAINKPNLIHAMFQVINIQLAQSDSKEVLKEEEIAKLFDSVNFDNVEIWVAKNDYSMRKVLFEGTIVDNSNANPSPSKMSMVIEVTDINKSVNINVPEDAKSIFEVFPILGMMLGSAN